MTSYNTNNYVKQTTIFMQYVWIWLVEIWHSFFDKKKNDSGTILRWVFFHQKYSFHTNFLLTQKSLTILAFTGEISLLWKLISLSYIKITKLLIPYLFWPPFVCMHAWQRWCSDWTLHTRQTNTSETCSVGDIITRGWPFHYIYVRIPLLNWGRTK